jgi:hypothetical protein
MDKKSFNLFRVMFSGKFFAVMSGMMVFGIVDNGIMIMAGDSIDHSISSTFGFSTMASAGLGNTISDAVGVLAGSIIAKLVFNIFGKVEEGDIGEKTYMAAETVGITVGCLIGMTPLLFL